MRGIAIHIDGLEEIAALWAQAPEIMEEELERTTWEAELLLEREIKDRTPVGVGGAGGLRGSIAAQPPRVLAGNVLGVVGTSVSHAVPVELGTRPHFPPLQPLEDWARQKLGVSAEQAPGVALAIARKIAARGTPGVGMFHMAFALNRGQVRRMYEQANVRIVRRLRGGH